MSTLFHLHNDACEGVYFLGCCVTLHMLMPHSTATPAAVWEANMSSADDMTHTRACMLEKHVCCMQMQQKILPSSIPITPDTLGVLDLHHDCFHDNLHTCEPV